MEQVDKALGALYEQWPSVSEGQMALRLCGLKVSLSTVRSWYCLERRPAQYHRGVNQWAAIERAAQLPRAVDLLRLVTPAVAASALLTRGIIKHQRTLDSWLVYKTVPSASTQEKILRLFCVGQLQLFEPWGLRGVTVHT